MLDLLLWSSIAIVVVSVGWAIFQGWATFLGTVAGVTLGFLIAGGVALHYAASTYCPDPECGIFGALFATLAAVMGAAIGGVIGGLIGFIASRSRRRGRRAIGFGEPHP